MFALALIVTDTLAGTCTTQVNRLKAAPKANLPKAYTALAQCNNEVAENTFSSVVTKADDADSLVALSLAAINTDGWNAVWSTIGKIADYDARDAVAAGIGEQCGDHPKVTQFLQGAYYGLKDSDFRQWDDAFVSCPSEKLEAWLQKQVAAPPTSTFDEKYNTLLEIIVEKHGAKALPTLADAAIKASTEGPFDAILIQMDAAVAPSLGEEMSPEDKKALEDGLIAVAKGVPPAKAKNVADRLVNADATNRAVELLPVIYADRMKNGMFTYGAVAIESGDCKGTKTAVLHWAHVADGGTRWDLLPELEDDLTAYKPRLGGKCQTDGPWTLLVSSEPLDGAKGVTDWISELESQWQDKGYSVALRSEESVGLE